MKTAVETNKVAESSTNFEVVCVQTTGKESMYTHWSEGLTMYIVKDGKTITFNSKEIQQIVKALPRTVGGTY